MKQKFILGMSFIMAVNSFPVYSLAQSSPSVSVIAGAGSGTTSMLSAGTYNQIQQDNTKLLTLAMDQLKNNQQIDRDYLNEINNRLLNGVKGMIDLGNRFRVLSQQATTGMIKLQDYLDLVNKIKLEEQRFSAELQTLTLMSRDTLPSATQVSVGGVQADLSSAGNINMTEVSNRFSKLRDDLMAEMNSLQFANVVTERNQVFPINENALTPQLKGIQILSPAEIAQKTQELETLLSLEGSTTRLQRQYIERTRNNIRQFVELYGNEESFRFRDENDKKAKQEAFANIQDIFFRRSFLRNKYGIPMGALKTVKYNKNIANTEKYLTSFKSLSEYLTMIDSQAAISREEVQAAFENARNFVQMYDEQLTPIFSKKTAEERAKTKAAQGAQANGSFFDRAKNAVKSAASAVTSQFAGKEEIMSQADKKLEYSSSDTGFLVRANSVMTFLSGKQPTTEVILAVMRMVLADAREEMMLLQNDRAALQAYHSQLFNSTPELKLISAKKICQMDYTLSEQTHKNNCATEAVGVKFKAQAPRGQPGNDIAGLFSGLLNSYEGVEKKKNIDAQNIRNLIALANSAANTAESQEQEDDLFNK